MKTETDGPETEIQWVKRPRWTVSHLMLGGSVTTWVMGATGVCPGRLVAVQLVEGGAAAELTIDLPAAFAHPAGRPAGSAR